VTERYRIVDTGFEPADMPPLEADENALRVRDRLTDDEYQHLAQLLEPRPDAGQPSIATRLRFDTSGAKLVSD
jgi:hypothetical protein